LGASTYKPRIALVLSGGAARGAYEAGVIRYLRDYLHKETGVPARFDILCGSSVGALNACFMAALAHRPDEQGELLARRWTSLKIDDVLRLRTTDLMRFVRSLMGLGPSPLDLHRHGGLIDPEALEQLVLDGGPWSFIPRNVASGKVMALSVSCTHVSSGHTVVFVQRADGSVPAWSSDPFVHAMSAKIRPQHALASAAIPVLFPAVSIDGQYYCDGGLRQNTPLSPALRLGAERVLVISLRHIPDESERSERVSLGGGIVDAPPSPYFLFGKVINALWLDHVDYDLDRLRRTNAVLDAGTRAFGPDFAARLNGALVASGAPPLRGIHELRVQPSRDIGSMGAAYARSEGFLSRVSGIAGTVLRRMVFAEGSSDTDLLSYLLFDGGFAEQLIDLGIQDARAMRDDLARFFDGG
jgi:NTE family protein